LRPVFPASNISAVVMDGRGEEPSPVSAQQNSVSTLNHA
jgi:hypothetical protein